jgi:hypothetical protein
MTTTLDTAARARVYRALKSAMRSGVDPYNSHAAQSAKWLRAAKDAHRRSAGRGEA